MPLATDAGRQFPGQPIPVHRGPQPLAVQTVNESQWTIIK